jgi:magnesium-transporting ATPase (P-type)
MLPTQILLNNFLYDLARVTIPTDHVDNTFIRKPQRWNVQMIRDFTIYIGPLSSIYDFLTFFALLRVFHCEQLSHRLVCRVSGNADTGNLHYSHRLIHSQPAQSRTDYYHDSGRRGGVVIPSRHSEQSWDSYVCPLLSFSSWLERQALTCCWWSW